MHRGRFQLKPPLHQTPQQYTEAGEHFASPEIAEVFGFRPTSWRNRRWQSRQALVFQRLSRAEAWATQFQRPMDGPIVVLSSAPISKASLPSPLKPTRLNAHYGGVVHLLPQDSIGASAPERAFGHRRVCFCRRDPMADPHSSSTQCRFAHAQDTRAPVACRAGSFRATTCLVIIVSLHCEICQSCAPNRFYAEFMSDSGRHRQLDQLRPMLDDMDEPRPKLARVGLSLARLGQAWLNSGQHWPDSAKFGLHLPYIRQVGRTRATFGQHVAKLRPELHDFGPTWPSFAPKAAPNLFGA